MSTTFTGEVAPVSDLQFDLALGPVSPKSLDERAAFLASLGFQRMYVVVPMVSVMAPWRDGKSPKQDKGQGAWPSRFPKRDPFHEAVMAAHRHGLQVFAVFKPYEGGALKSLPEGEAGAASRTSLPQLGGPAKGLDPFIVQHPHLRVRRRPDPERERLSHEPIDRIECCFCLDEVTQPTTLRGPEVFHRQADSAIVDNPITDLQLWTSSTNGTYEPYEGDFRVSERVESRVLRDTLGRPLTNHPQRCRVLEIAGLNWPSETPYAAVSFGAKDPDALVTIPFSMIHAYTASGQSVPITVSDVMREAKPTSSKGDEIESLCPRGFEFESKDFLYWEPGWRPMTAWGMARGKMEFMKGTLCEGYPEVRSYWLSEAERLIRMGVDGIDIRAVYHSGGMTDYTEFGYNEPIVAAYRDEYGTDILTEPADPMRIMRIRGDYYLNFIADLRDLLHEHDRVLQVHMRGSYERPTLSGDFNQIGFWAMPKILPDWERMVDLCDEVTIKDLGFGVYRPENAAGIKARAAAAGKPVWVQCYLQQGGDLNPRFCAAAEADPTVSGLALYELAQCSAGPQERFGGMVEGIVGVSEDGTLDVNEEAVATIRQLTRYAQDRA